MGFFTIFAYYFVKFLNQNFAHSACTIGIRGNFLMNWDLDGAVRYWCKIKFRNFFYLTVYPCNALFDLKTSWKINLIWQFFFHDWQIFKK